MSQLLRELILPPGGILVLVGFAGLVYRKSPRLSVRIWILAASLLYLLSVPPVAFSLAQLTYTEPALSQSALAAFKPQAIVVLGGGRDLTSPEYEGLPTPGRSTLQRVRYAAHLAKKTGLPVLVTGGFGPLKGQSEAWAMRINFGEYGLTPKWTETESQTTSENASGSWALLQPEKVERILLVTSSYHAHRARSSFEAVGFKVLPAPTAFELPRPEGPWLLNLVPQSSAFSLSSDSLRALLGEVWYRILGR